MSDRNVAKAVQALFKQMQKMSKALTKGLMNWLLRTAFILNRSVRSPASGFVLPTVVLLLLVVSLTVGALVFRAYNRSAQVIGESQQRVIYNAATPAIDRARAKLETLFDATKDNRYPGGVPAENYMTGMLRNDGSYSVGALPGTDQYTIPDETRLNLDGTTKTGESTPLDNAWAFRTDTNGDGTIDATVVYSIVLQTPTDTTAGVAGSGLVNTSETDKANNLWVRQGPLSNQLRGNCAIAQNTTTSSAAQGWFQDLSSSSTLRKNFQVDALVIPDTVGTSGTFTTLEFQQDRKLDRGNKWGAWFRYDMEIWPGPQFNWNGAMHTEGSLMVKPTTGFDAYLVSSQASCLMSSASNSEITVTNITNPTSDATKPPDYIGLAFGGSMRDNDYNGSANIHIWPATTNPAQPSQTVTLDTDNTGSATKTSATDQVALDPVKLLTEDVSQARGSAPPTTPHSNRASPVDYKSGWKGLPDTGTPRVFNQAETKPYVDDLYRADNRWGPKPRYSDQIAVKSPNKVGDLITTTNVAATADYNTLVGNDYVASNPSTAASVGLDGYWERRAYNEGMRLIVGQRLDLGDSGGWAGTSDPLYPPNATTTHEVRQHRTLRDNLAAVQATAVYHKDSAAGPNLPAACFASTAHPGTAATLANSINFNPVTRNFLNSTGASVSLITDFLNGAGTNGWEFQAPTYFATETAFTTAIGSTQPLGKALRNLAHLAGDPDGAFPPKQEAAGSTIVHPYPLTSMWGNFSELRRTLARLDGGTAYADLSLADKTTLHTAACTLGMLAYQLSTVQGASIAQTASSLSSGDLTNLGVQLWKNFAGTGGSPSATALKYCVEKPVGSKNYDCTNSPNTPILPLPSSLVNGLNSSQLTVANLISLTQQISRDRQYGFLPSANYTTSAYSVQDGSNTYSFKFPAGCDPSDTTGDPNNPSNIFASSGNGIQQKRAGIAMLCALQPMYPSLFYLFPKVSHDYNGDTTQSNLQPTTEPYPNDSYIQSTSSSTYQYQVVGATVDDFSAIAMQPQAASTGWKLPILQTRSNIASANVSPNMIIDTSGNLRAVGFLDRGVFNGREMMGTRMMDIDLGMLRSLGVATGKPWLPTSGIVYAFREDAVREDAIARPAGGAAPVVTNATNPASPTDPTLATTSNGISLSTKQVDYIADPDRRPNGFRLRNGVQLKRNDSFGLASTDNTRGLSFFTDSPVHIQGDFNLHKTGADDTAGTTVEEFDQTLVPGSGANGIYTQTQFYGRTTRSTKFATIGAGDSNHDRWRPTEILADAVSILSDSFCDGSIEDGFVSSSGAISDGAKYNNISSSTNPGYGLFGPGCANGGKTSFVNQNQPSSNIGATNWLREDGSSTSTFPIRIDRNGNPVKSNSSAYTGTYEAFTDSKPLMTATNTTVDSIIVSGIVPSRSGQSYGGLHNFPRLLEDWGNKNLWFAGSFLQLSFSNMATAPYDQDVWEPASPLTTSPSTEANNYYVPPNRIWGYDPALQLAPAGPAAARFITAGKNRNEFYTELPVNDPYIKNLCNAVRTSGISGVPANINCPA